MSQTLLATTLTAVARTIGDHLPAAFEMQPGEVQVGGDASDHPQPQAARTVRWTLGAGDGHLAISLTSDAADVLLAEGDQDLVGAMHDILSRSAGLLAPIFGGAAPILDGAEEVTANTALAEGPGDVATIVLDDAGTHRATIGLRMVIPDALVSTDPADAPIAQEAAAPGGAQAAAPQAAAPQAAAPGVPLPAQGAPAGAGPVALQGPEGVVGAGPVALEAEEPAVPHVVGAAPMGAPGLAGGMAGAPQAPRRRPGVQAPVGEAHPADFASFDQLTALPGQQHPMSLLGDVEMGVTAELGRTELTVRDVLGLTPGSIIELDRAAGSPVDVVVNGTLIARGEVVVIDEEFGIRITEILGMTAEVNPFPVAQ